FMREQGQREMSPIRAQFRRVWQKAEQRLAMLPVEANVVQRYSVRRQAGREVAAAGLALHPPDLENVCVVGSEAEADRSLDVLSAVVRRPEPPVACPLPQERPHGEMQGPERDRDVHIAQPIRVCQSDRELVILVTDCGPEEERRTAIQLENKTRQ